MPNINRMTSGWVDIYGESGIAVGTPVLIQNQGDVTVFVRENLVDSGYMIPPLTERVATGTTVLQASAFGGLSIFVQVIAEDTP